MLSVECTTCNRNVPLYKLEKHHEDHINNKEKEDREFTEMVNNIEVIRVKRRVPAEKEKKKVVEEGKVVGQCVYWNFLMKIKFHPSLVF